MIIRTLKECLRLPRYESKTNMSTEDKLERILIDCDFLQMRGRVVTHIIDLAKLYLQIYDLNPALLKTELYEDDDFIAQVAEAYALARAVPEEEEYVDEVAYKIMLVGLEGIKRYVTKNMEDICYDFRNLREDTIEFPKDVLAGEAVASLQKEARELMARTDDSIQ